MGGAKGYSGSIAHNISTPGAATAFEWIETQAKILYVEALQTITYGLEKELVKRCDTRIIAK